MRVRERERAHFQVYLMFLVKNQREDGMYGFYRGMVPNIMRVVPSSAITFLVYEKTKNLIEWLEEEHCV